MSLKKLKLVNFRSYTEEEFSFDPNVTVILGPNGSGKTNILEAIYMLGMTRGFRGLNQQLVKSGEEWFRVEAEFSDDKELVVTWKNGQKKIVYNQQEVKPQDFIGSVPVVMFEPGSLQTVYGPPYQRRRLLDRVLSFTDKKYLKALLQVRRILKQRNSLLKQKAVKKDQIFGWDVLLVEQADYIRVRREELIKHLNRLLSKTYKDISRSSDKLTLNYNSKTTSDNYADELLRQLEKNIDMDFKYGSTSAGPHRDDIGILYNGQSLVDVGSRGEVRTTVASLVLAELAYLKKNADSRPVLLLDDVFSELDENRQTALLENISDVQTIITTTHIPPQLENSYARIELYNYKDNSKRSGKG